MTVKSSSSEPTLLIVEQNGWREARLRPIPITSTSLTRADESLASLKASRILSTARTAEEVLRHRASWTSDAARIEAKKQEAAAKAIANVASKAERAQKRADAIQRRAHEEEVQSRQAFFHELARVEAEARTERQQHQKDELQRFRRMRSASERSLQSRQAHDRSKLAGSESLRHQVSAAHIQPTIQPNDRVPRCTRPCHPFASPAGCLPCLPCAAA
jgi:hypothetical protein